MKKRSKYKPRPVIPNVMDWLVGGAKLLSKHNNGNDLLRVKFSLHQSALNLAQGVGGWGDLDNIMWANNLCLALMDIGYGREYRKEAYQSRTALMAVCQRWKESGEAKCGEEELPAINEMLEIYEAQLESVTFRDWELANQAVLRTITTGNAIVV